MHTAYAVIGAGYGDEGKGLITDYLCAEKGSEMVVRCNGGAQAGHTVVTPQGQRHVFHHFGSGTFLGAQTFLAEKFIVNPLMFCEELQTIASLKPKISADVRCFVTTPYDMLINQVLETGRGVRRHGSCGVGINETLVRCEAHPEFRLAAGMLLDKRRTRTVIENIKCIYVPMRLRQVGLPDDALDVYLESEQLAMDFNEAIEGFLETCYVTRPHLLKRFGNIIFEGAQGLALDQGNEKDFPHLTPSNTGLKNLIAVCREADIEIVRPLYVTRCYSTRHGAGPLPGETTEPYPLGVLDETNVCGNYQGSFRFARLDLPALRTRINDDLHGWGYGVRDPAIAVTCLDHLNGQPLQFSEGGLRLTSEASDPQEITMLIASTINVNMGYLWSTGKTREDVNQGEWHETSGADYSRLLQHESDGNDAATGYAGSSHGTGRTSGHQQQERLDVSGLDVGQGTDTPGTDSPLSGGT